MNKSPDQPKIKRPFELSVLDLCPVSDGSTAAKALENSFSLAKMADDVGYKRYWFAEHHSMGAIASSAPEIMIGQIAAVTKNLRVGSGGIMLPNHAPLRIAEAFRTLEALFPGRIDLGLGRAPGTGTRATIALRRSVEAVRADNFTDEFDELISFLTDHFEPGHPFASVTAVPNGVAMPEIWLLGSSDYSAQMAARLGFSFAFAQHFSPLPASEILPLYQRNFKPSRFLQKPYSMVATNVVCAETDKEAQRLASSGALGTLRYRRTGRFDPLPSNAEAASYPYTTQDLAEIRAHRKGASIGSQALVRESLLKLSQETGADEIMISSLIFEPKDRVQSYRLIAEAL